MANSACMTLDEPPMTGPNASADFAGSSPDYEEPDLYTLSKRSIVEARDKEIRLLEFYEDPYGDQSETWPLATISHHYDRLYKKEGSKRKNRYQENILHEFDINFLFKALLQSGILPRKVTYQIIDGKRHTIPKALQSTENVFALINCHDTDEDFPDSSPEELERYSLFMLNQMPLQNKQQKTYYERVACLVDMQRAMTFGRKTRDGHKHIIVEKTHKGDPQIYLDAMENFWPAITAKGGDRLRGLVERYSTVAKVFTLEQQKKYLAETQDLFYYRRTLENMQVRYPELKEALEVINARMEIAYRSLSMLVSFHPDNTEASDRKTSNPLTARLDIRGFLSVATKIDAYLDDDANDLKDLLINLEYVAARYPTLRNITNQLREQLTEFMPELENIPPIFGAASVMPDKSAMAPAFI